MKVTDPCHGSFPVHMHPYTLGSTYLHSGDTPDLMAAHANVADTIPRRFTIAGFRWRGGIGTALLVPATLVSCCSPPDFVPIPGGTCGVGASHG